MLEELSRDAQSRERQRLNFNLHPALDDAVQRLCNAMEPATYVRPHRHPEAGKWELFTVLRGSLVALTFDDEGRVTSRTELSCEGPDYIIEIPGNTWHTLLSNSPGTVAFEVKPGPYLQLSDKDFAAWAPTEGAPEVVGFLEWLRAAKVGSQAPLSGT
ncbi:MAG: WbuC family cupin fold metalloprotein [Pseudomonadota bacterium]|nr:MAG: WbuC family cupin fold metalloprotein [Pseudomonadota bacterium]